jgi:hypothetical protein
LGHGFFTDVLIKGLNGGAECAQERKVRMMDLAAFVEREVRKATNADSARTPGLKLVVIRM